jgi:hypothetical protein
LDILYNHIRLPWQGDVDVAALVIAALGAVDIGKPNDDPLDLLKAVAQSKAQAPLHVVVNALGKHEMAGLYLYVHGDLRVSLCVVQEKTRALPGFDIVEYNVLLHRKIRSI